MEHLGGTVNGRLGGRSGTLGNGMKWSCNDLLVLLFVFADF